MVEYLVLVVLVELTDVTSCLYTPNSIRVTVGMVRSIGLSSELIHIHRESLLVGLELVGSGSGLGCLNKLLPIQHAILVAVMRQYAPNVRQWLALSQSR